MHLRALLFLGCFIFSAQEKIVLYGQSTETMGNWSAYAADKASSKYSPLDQIDKSNAQLLEIAWRQSTIPEAIREGNSMPAPQRSQNTPLMVDGRLFISTPLGIVTALDAQTGEVLWFDAKKSPVGSGTATRGLAYWSAKNISTEPGRVIAIVGPYLVAFNEETGQRFQNFGCS